MNENMRLRMEIERYRSKGNLEKVKELEARLPRTISEIMLALWEWAGDNGFLEYVNKNPNNFKHPQIPKDKAWRAVEHIKKKYPATPEERIEKVVNEFSLLKVVKKSGKPFKSGFWINTVKGKTINPNCGKEAYIFKEDDSVVNIDMCEEYREGN